MSPSMELRERLDDLLTEIPSYVAPDASTAWRTGRRRRTRRRVLAAATVLGVLALVAGVVTAGVHVTEPQPTGDGSGARLTYPARIERPLLFTGTLADDAGAIAGVVQRPDGWYAVGQRGQVWRLPGATDTSYLPSISPDGSGLAYVRSRGDQRRLVLSDLQTGSVTERATRTSSPIPFALRQHTQLFWSPASANVLVPVVRGVGVGEAVALVISPDGDRRYVTQRVQGRMLPAGWFDEHTLAWVMWTRGHAGLPLGSASVLLTSLEGRVKRRIPLRIKGVWTDAPDSTSVSVAPGGDVLALGTDQGPDLSVWWFHLRGPLRGRVKAELPPSPYGSAADCPASWSTTILLPASGYPDTILRAPGGGSQIYADPRLRISCSVWPAGALSGTPYRDLTARIFDDSGRLHLGTTSWLAWHWRETLILGVTGLLLVVGGTTWWCRWRKRT